MFKRCWAVVATVLHLVLLVTSTWLLMLLGSLSVVASLFLHPLCSLRTASWLCQSTPHTTGKCCRRRWPYHPSQGFSLVFCLHALFAHRSYCIALPLQACNFAPIFLALLLQHVCWDLLTLFVLVSGHAFCTHSFAPLALCERLPACWHAHFAGCSSHIACLLLCSFLPSGPLHLTHHILLHTFHVLIF